MTNSEARRRYAEVFHDLEVLIQDHIEMASAGTPQLSRLCQLVPSVGVFFTKLPLEKAYYIEDERRSISKRRLVAPSFNDIRLILNTAQILQLATNFHSARHQHEKLQLVTFDGDITLYDDGTNLDPDSPLLPYLLQLLEKGLYIGIVTAAGYKEPEKYYGRLAGLIDGIKTSTELTDAQRENLLVMGGEANYLYRYQNDAGMLVTVPRDQWVLDTMNGWDEDDIKSVLDYAESGLNNYIEKLSVQAIVIRKERGVGIVAKPGHKLIREQLEELVLRIDRNLRQYPPAQKINWCAFNGGSDVWVDIGDKSLGVRALQQFLRVNDGKDIKAASTLHVGDQFSSIGANDYASRTAATTAWISSPMETKNLLVDLNNYLENTANY
ncbi:unnamed protein product [Ambrosiozyma monospora]|uniref:Unnamed protein product n=1 Tax=Ambrosiozyma monospora TaxID=43982 RepID=A0ACB5SXQ4_AMBMO|nr:unnamed protein product [Ambrosiozyma monospora]